MKPADAPLSNRVELFRSTEPPLSDTLSDHTALGRWARLRSRSGHRNADHPARWRAHHKHALCLTSSSEPVPGGRGNVFGIITIEGSTGCLTRRTSRDCPAIRMERNLGYPVSGGLCIQKTSCLVTKLPVLGTTAASQRSEVAKVRLNRSKACIRKSFGKLGDARKRLKLVGGRGHQEYWTSDCGGSLRQVTTIRFSEVVCD